MVILFSKGCVEIQNPPQFTLEEVVTLDFRVELFQGGVRKRCFRLELFLGGVAKM